MEQYFGFPHTTILDNAYDTREAQEFAASRHINLIFCSSDEHKQNGQVERINRYLGEQLRTFER